MAITDKITRATDSTTGRPVIAKLASGKAIGAASVSLTVATNWTTNSPIYGAMYLLTSAGVKDPTTQIDWKATLTGTTLSNFTVTGGTDRAYTTDAYVEITITAAQLKDMYDFLDAEHNVSDGTHDNTKVALLAGSQTITGTKTFSTAPVLPNNAIPGTALATSAITLGYVQITSNFATASTSFVDVTSMTTTVTVPAGGRRVEFNIDATGINNSTTSSAWGVALVEDGTIIQQWWRNQDGAGFNMPLSLHYSKTPSAGSHTYKVQLTTQGGTVTIVATGTAGTTPFTAAGPASLLVKAI